MAVEAIQEFADRVETQGLDYAITEYLSPEDLEAIQTEDPQLADDLEEVQQRLRRIEGKLEPYLP